MEKKNITITVDDALTQTDAAKILDITTMTLWRWIRDGKIATITFGRFKLIPKNEVERLLKERG